jgi:hypothetical protein
MILTASADTTSKIFFPKNFLNSIQEHKNVLFDQKDLTTSLKLYSIDMNQLVLISQNSKYFILFFVYTYRNPLKVYAALIFSSGHKCCT